MARCINQISHCLKITHSKLTSMILRIFFLKYNKGKGENGNQTSFIDEFLINLGIEVILAIAPNAK